MLVCDSATAVTRERTPEGFLRVRARIGRAGLQRYRAGEIGAPPDIPPDRTLTVYRAPEDVFDTASLASFEAKPVTLDHPPQMVDASNWTRYAIGHSGRTISRDGDHVAADLTITDAAAVQRAEAGAELSNGYWADFVFEPGRTPAGEPYDALQRNIRGNHIALVDAGRCGPTCRIDAAADTATTDKCACRAEDALPAAHRVKINDDGRGDTGPAAAAGIAQIRRALDDALTAHGRALAMKDGEIAALKAAIPGVAALDALVEERIETIAAARSVLGPGFDARGQSTEAIRRAAVSKVLGFERTRDRSDDYVGAAFDTLIAAGQPGNVLAGHLLSSVADGGASREAALQARNLYLSQAWKGQSSGDT